MYHLVVKAASIDRYYCLSGSLPVVFLNVCANVYCVNACVYFEANKYSSSSSSSSSSSTSLVMSECSLSGRGQDHVSNFYIVDLENFATANRLYTAGDIHNSTVVGLFMTPIRQ